MIRFFRKTRKGLMDTNQIWKYSKYAIGEIFLVVVGILIALQINNWNNKRLENKEAQTIYHNIKQQIQEDRSELNKEQQVNVYLSKTYAYANNIIRSNNRKKADTLAMIAMTLSQYSDFHKSGNLYETLVTSGDLKLIKNSDLIRRLQRLEMTYTFVNNLEDIHWDIIINELSPLLRGVINYDTFKPVQPDRLYEVEIQNFLVETLYLTGYKSSQYQQAISEIDTILTMIDRQIEVY